MAGFPPPGGRCRSPEGICERFVTGCGHAVARRQLVDNLGSMTSTDEIIALKVVDDPNILVNVVSRRVKQLKRGNRPLIESLEKPMSKFPTLPKSVFFKSLYM